MTFIEMTGCDSNEAGEAAFLICRDWESVFRYTMAGDQKILGVVFCGLRHSFGNFHKNMFRLPVRYGRKI